MDKPDSPTKLGPVEMYFKTYFEFLGSFSCDKAKDFAEKQKEQHLPTPLQVNCCFVDYRICCLIFVSLHSGTVLWSVVR